MWGVSMGSIVGNLKLSAWRDFIAGLKIKSGGNKMCLQRLEDFNVKLNKDGIGVGYKIFCEIDGRLCGEYARPRKERRVGVWLKEENFRPRRTNTRIQRIERKYKRGWHIFLRRKDADNWRGEGKDIRKVEFRGIVTMGRNSSNNKVIVAKEIFIPDERT